jgi:hypothetical protein
MQNTKAKRAERERSEFQKRKKNFPINRLCEARKPGERRAAGE